MKIFYIFTRYHVGVIRRKIFLGSTEMTIFKFICLPYNVLMVN